MCLDIGPSDWILTQVFGYWSRQLGISLGVKILVKVSGYWTTCLYIGVGVQIVVQWLNISQGV